MCKSKKVPYGSFYEDELFLDSGASAYFTLFETDFVDITLSNYGWVETANFKALLFMVTSSTVLIEHEIFDLAKGTTKITVSKLWPVNCVLLWSQDLKVGQEKEPYIGFTQENLMENSV